MAKNDVKGVKIESLVGSVVSGSVICLIFQKNGIVRINNKYITKREAKKFAKK